MDYYCPICGQAWNILDIHDVAEYNGETFDQVKERFYLEGCTKVFREGCQPFNLEGYFYCTPDGTWGLSASMTKHHTVFVSVMNPSFQRVQAFQKVDRSERWELAQQWALEQN